MTTSPASPLSRTSLSRLGSSELERLRTALTPRLDALDAYCPFTPTPKQTAFLLCEDLELFYGGAAGGAKSWALLMAALQYVDVAGYHALILRRSYTDLALPEAVMSVAEEWLTPTDASWNEIDKTWTFPSGATLTFGYLQIEKHKYRYQGSAYQFIGFDELTQFTETQYTYLFSRMRKSVRLSGVPLRMRSTSNPGGEGHEWVKARFKPHLAARGVFDRERPVIRASIKDNPHLDESYRKSLAQLDVVTRAQLEGGDWDIAPAGNMFAVHWFPIRPMKPYGIVATIRMWDLAATEKKSQKEDPDWTAGAKVSLLANGAYLIEDVVRLRGSPGEVETAIANTASQDGWAVPVGIEREPGASGKSLVWHYRSHVLVGYSVVDFEPSGDKVVRAGPMSSSAEAGNLHLLVGEWNEAFVKECLLFPTKGAHDDQVDAASAAIIELAHGVGGAQSRARDTRLRGRR